MTGSVAPRAAGERIELAAAPERVRAWIDAELTGRVVAAESQRGGMSPGPAARIVLDDGRRYFVKAVGSDLNRGTVRLFRHELEVLRRLPAVEYRPALVAAYDDGEWVALVLEDVDGATPDLDDVDQMGAARDTVRRQTSELTPDPVGLDGETLAGSVRRWYDVVSNAAPEVRATLPAWWRERADELLGRVGSLVERVPSESWCHLDIRDDNLVRRRDGRVVVVDWGMSRRGPAWVDEVFLLLHHVTDPSFDDGVREIPAYGVASDRGREEAVTDLLLALGGSLAVAAQGPSHGLPRLASFRRAESARLLAGAARRLAVA